MFVVRFVEKWRRDNQACPERPITFTIEGFKRLETPMITPFDDCIPDTRLNCLDFFFGCCWGLGGGVIVRFEGVFVVRFVEKWRRDRQTCPERPITVTIEDFSMAQNTSDSAV